MQGVFPVSYSTVSRDVDEFLQRLYTQRVQNGMAAMTVMRVGNLVTIPAIGALVVLLVGFVQWDAITRCPSTLDGCGALSQYLDGWGPPWFTFRKLFMFSQIVAPAVWWLLHVLFLPVFFRVHGAVRDFYRRELDIDDGSIHEYSWEEVMTRLVGDEPEIKGGIVRRLARKDDFWSAVYRSDMLRPFLIRGVTWSAESDILHRVLDMCLVNHVTSTQFVENGVLPPASNIRWGMVLLAVAMLVGLPFLLPFTVLHTLFRHLDELRRNQTTARARTSTSKTKYLLRTYNELPLEVDRRVSRATELAAEYLECFTYPLAHSVASMLLMVFGFAAGVLWCLALFDEAILLTVTIGRHNLLWYAGVTSVIVSVARGFVAKPGKDVISQAPEKFAALVATTGYSAPDWQQASHREDVRAQVAALFPNTLTKLLRELVAVILVPFQLLWVMNTVRIEGFRHRLGRVTIPDDVAGYVCQPFDHVDPV